VIEQSEEAIIGLVVISRQLHYLLSQITTDSARQPKLYLTVGGAMRPPPAP
jgi:hypothetical protein